ncbi:MAG: hypothetical protein ACFFG0_17130 [Candidatus Thorarchaeota archaeon]
MGIRIEELDRKNIGMFYDGISVSFVPGYELESKNDFENIVCNELKANPKAFFQMLNDKS